jgi:hypothetical protein
MLQLPGVYRLQQVPLRCHGQPRVPVAQQLTQVVADVHIAA